MQLNVNRTKMLSHRPVAKYLPPCVACSKVFWSEDQKTVFFSYQHGFRFIPYFFSSYSCWWWKVFLLSLVCICLRSNENHPDPPTLSDQPSSATKPRWQCPSLRHGYETRNHGNGDKRLMAFLVLKGESTSFLWKQRKRKEQGLNLLHLTPDALLFSRKEQNKK